MVYDNSCRIGGKLDLDDLVEASEVGDCRCPISWLPAIRWSHGWLIVRDDTLTLTTGAAASGLTAAPAAKRATAPAKAAPTITLKHLAAALSASHDLPKKQAEAVLGDLVTLTTRHLRRGDKIRLNGLCILQVRKRAARMGRNPATGEAIRIKASKKVAFRVAKELKEAV